MLFPRLESPSVISCQIEFGCMDYVFRFAFLSNILDIQKVVSTRDIPKTDESHWKTKTLHWKLVPPDDARETIYLETTLYLLVPLHSCDEFHVSC